MGKVLVSASHFDILCKGAWTLLEKNGHKVIFDSLRPFPAYSYEELLQILPDIDAAIIGMDLYDEKVFKIAPKLKCVCKFGVGVDNVNLADATKYDVKVCNCPGQNSNAVAELTIGFIIDVLRGITPLHKAMEKSSWPRYLGEELAGKTVGLFGFGAIARLVAKKLSAFDMKIKAYDLYPNESAAKELGIEMVSQDEIIETCDIISLHAPATKENYHLFGAKTFARMKNGAYLINAARGALVDLDALAEALKSGKIAGAALDAFEEEPLPSSASILQCENIVLTPHTGAETRQAYDKVSMVAAQNVVDTLAGREPKYWVNR
ncbi:phosphoglycerate dehydrogenase [Caproiciproducens sp. NJN-50]|uniref:phosphoglycerate dehydrogenase n=1 Tax=Acutalibacteraceae TaxID=3082771 RepID=UPI000FFDFA60|nr:MULTISPECIES: phosphoglycerate dehydrogenase [Acutalibacteraceae]QAT50731.1 phosphoglycerate dehydrogenase [Caproiciproducens sp. NJN-50]